MDRRTFHSSLLLGALTAPFAGAGVADARSTGAVPRRMITEYGLPPARETHELVKLPGLPLVLVSQMSNSHLVKLRLDPDTEEIVAAQAFPLGESDDLLHGLALSRRYPGHVWATHEGGNRLLLVDPGSADVTVPPRVVRTIDIPDRGRGPHYVGEYGDMLWVSLKRSDDVLAIDHTVPSRFRLYPAQSHPIFVARHPASGEFYASQDSTSQILRIDPRTNTTSQIPVPPQYGSTPVGLVPGPAGAWVALLGTTEQGTGVFGRIAADGTITWFRLRSPEIAHAGVLHIAFDPPGATTRPSAWLLGSSIICPTVLDVVIRVTFDDHYSQVTGEEVMVLPTQQCKAHRLLPLRRSLLTTELTSATVAHLSAPPGSLWERPTTPTSGDPS